MAARVHSLEMRRHLPNDARPDSYAYKTIMELFPGEPLLPWLRHLIYLVPCLGDCWHPELQLHLEPQLCLELKTLLPPSLITFSFKAEEPNSDVILDILASTCQGISGLTWKKPGFTTNLPNLLSRFSMLLSLDVNYAELTDENIGIISRLSSLTHFKIFFDVDWHQQTTAPFNNIHRILGILDISCLNGSCLHTLVASLMWEAPRPCSSICHIISSLKTLSLNFIVPNRPDDPIDVEKFLEPFGHATAITQLSIKFYWWTMGDTLNRHLSELLKNFPPPESLSIKFRVAASNWANMGSLQLVANAVKTCPKLKRIRFVGNINPTLLDGPLTGSFANLEELDLSKSRALDVHHRLVGMDQGILKEFIESLVPGLSLDCVALDWLNCIVVWNWALRPIITLGGWLPLVTYIIAISSPLFNLNRWSSIWICPTRLSG